MKIKILIATIISAFVLISCDKSVGDTYDFSNSLPNYVEFKSVIDPSTGKIVIPSISVKQGAKANFTIVTKGSFFKDTQISVKIEGAGLSETKTVTLEKMKTSVTDSFTIPETTTVGSAFTITLISAKTEGADVKVGRIDAGTITLKGKVTAK